MPDPALAPPEPALAPPPPPEPPPASSSFVFPSAPRVASSSISLSSGTDASPSEAKDSERYSDPSGASLHAAMLGLRPVMARTCASGRLRVRAGRAGVSDALRVSILRGCFRVEGWSSLGARGVRSYHMTMCSCTLSITSTSSSSVMKSSVLSLRWCGPDISRSETPEPGGAFASLVRPRSAPSEGKRWGWETTRRGGGRGRSSDRARLKLAGRRRRGDVRCARGLTSASPSGLRAASRLLVRATSRVGKKEHPWTGQLLILPAIGGMVITTCPVMDFSHKSEFYA